jgi:excisionase family DNA binding protein
MVTAGSPMRALASENEARQLLTAEELAAAFKLNPQTLYRLARRGAIPAIRIGKKALRFDPIRVRQFLEARSPSQARVSPGRPPAEPFSFSLLEDLLAERRWTNPPPDLSLERFAVDIPPGSDLTTLAYERKRA